MKKLHKFILMLVLLAIINPTPAGATNGDSTTTPDIVIDDPGPITPVEECVYPNVRFVSGSIRGGGDTFKVTVPVSGPSMIEGPYITDDEYDGREDVAPQISEKVGMTTDTGYSTVSKDLEDEVRSATRTTNFSFTADSDVTMTFFHVFEGAHDSVNLSKVCYTVTPIQPEPDPVYGRIGGEGQCNTETGISSILIYWIEVTDFDATWYLMYNGDFTQYTGSYTANSKEVTEIIVEPGTYTVKTHYPADDVRLFIDVEVPECEATPPTTTTVPPTTTPPEEVTPVCIELDDGTFKLDEVPVSEAGNYRAPNIINGEPSCDFQPELPPIEVPPSVPETPPATPVTPPVKPPVFTDFGDEQGLDLGYTTVIGGVEVPVTAMEIIDGGLTPESGTLGLYEDENGNRIYGRHCVEAGAMSVHVGDTIEMDGDVYEVVSRTTIDLDDPALDQIYSGTWYVTCSCVDADGIPGSDARIVNELVLAA